MIFVKNSMGGREVNMINNVSKINLSKIGWEGVGSTSIWIMSLNILVFFWTLPLSYLEMRLSLPKLVWPQTISYAHDGTGGSYNLSDTVTSHHFALLCLLHSDHLCLSHKNHKKKHQKNILTKYVIKIQL